MGVLEGGGLFKGPRKQRFSWGELRCLKEEDVAFKSVLIQILHQPGSAERFIQVRNWIQGLGVGLCSAAQRPARSWHSQKGGKMPGNCEIRGLKRYFSTSELAAQSWLLAV